MFELSNLYRWCDAYGGGIVIANSLLEAQEKIEKMLEKDEERDPNDVIVWAWCIDDYFDKENPDVIDIY